MAPSCWPNGRLVRTSSPTATCIIGTTPATRIDTINYLQIADQGAELRRYRAGGLDITYTVPPAQFKWIRENLGAELHISPQLSTYYYGYNLYRAPFKDNPKLRLALSMVIDRERLTESVTGRGELPAYGWVPVGVANYESQRPEWAEFSFAERVARAKQLYAQAGYSSEHPLRTEIRYNIDESHTRIAVAIASMWKESLGVQTELVGEEFKVLLQNIDRHDVTQVFRSSWIGDYNDAYTFAQYLKSDFGLNLPGYRNPRYDALLTSAAAEVDTARRSSTLEEAERLMLLDQPRDPAVLLRQQTPGEALCRGLAQQRHERAVLQEPGAQETLARCKRRPVHSQCQAARACAPCSRHA